MMEKAKWPAHCRRCQYRVCVVCSDKSPEYVCDYMLRTGKSLVKEYGLQGELGKLQQLCTHYQDKKKRRKKWND